MAGPEEAQIKIISQFLPEQLSVSAVEKIIDDVIKKFGATKMKDMGKAMGMANKQLAGQADGKLIAEIVKNVSVHSKHSKAIVVKVSTFAFAKAQ